jgi:SAM-dependent methyltransferase
VNLFHRWCCRSAGWARHLEDVLPTVLAGLDLGEDVLELGPGPGLTTDWLRQRVPRLTAIELERPPAGRLRGRLAGTNVTVVEGDATDMPFPDESFSAVVSFTMLHHVPSIALQDRLLGEAQRVLRPGGFFAGMDSRPNLRWNLYHVFDTRTPVDPRAFPDRLRRAGFTDPRVDVNPQAFYFQARKR